MKLITMVAIEVLYLTGPIAAENIGYVDLQKVFINYKYNTNQLKSQIILTVLKNHDNCLAVNNHIYMTWSNECIKV